MEQYKVTGMSCAACSARVEKAVSKVPGVTSCSVSLLTNSMGVEGTRPRQTSSRRWRRPATARPQKGAEERAKQARQQRPRRRKRRNAEGSRDAGSEEAADCLPRFFEPLMYVSMGAYDVGMAGTGVSGKTIMWPWD